MKKLVLLFALLACLVAFNQDQIYGEISFGAWCKEQGYVSTGSVCIVEEDVVAKVNEEITIRLLNWNVLIIKGILNNYGILNSGGGIHIRSKGVLNNFNTVNIYPEDRVAKYDIGHIDNYGTFSNHNILNNSGGVNNYPGGNMFNYDSIINSGSFDPVSGGDFGITYNYGIIANFHTVNNIDGGYIWNYVNGSIYGSRCVDSNIHGPIYGNDVIIDLDNCLYVPMVSRD